jgi:hypothetical protein
MIPLWALLAGALLCAQESAPPAADKTAPAAAPSAENATADLQKAVQNPMASLISVPVQNNSNFSIGPYDQGHNTQGKPCRSNTRAYAG